MNTKENEFNINSNFSSCPPETALLLLDYCTPPTQITVNLQPFKALFM